MISRKCEQCGQPFTVATNREKRKLCWKCKPNRWLCLGCGRHSSQLKDGKCSFCVEEERKQLNAQKEEEKKGLNHCRECGRIINASSEKLHVLKKFQLCVMCFDAKNSIPFCPRCESNNRYAVRLSDQEAPEPDKVVWYCSRCDFCFTTEVRI